MFRLPPCQAKYMYGFDFQSKWYPNLSFIFYIWLPKTNFVSNVTHLYFPYHYFQYIVFNIKKKDYIHIQGNTSVFANLPWAANAILAGWMYLWKSVEVEGVVDTRLRSWTHPPPPTEADLPESLKLFPLYGVIFPFKIRALSNEKSTGASMIESKRQY